MADDEALRFPIGRFHRVTPPLDRAARHQLIDAIEQAPSIIRGLAGGLSDADLGRTYRPGGWTIRQVVHHVPDSHTNAYVRFKLAATEDTPAIKPYDEAAWATLGDVEDVPIGVSLDLLDALHRRWIAFLRRLPESDFSRAYLHPEMGKVPLDQALAIYAWHGQHHAAHIRLALR